MKKLLLILALVLSSVQGLLGYIYPIGFPIARNPINNEIMILLCQQVQPINVSRDYRFFGGTGLVSTSNDASDEDVKEAIVYWMKNFNLKGFSAEPLGNFELQSDKSFQAFLFKVDYDPTLSTRDFSVKDTDYIFYFAWYKLDENLVKSYIINTDAHANVKITGETLFNPEFKTIANKLPQFTQQQKQAATQAQTQTEAEAKAKKAKKAREDAIAAAKSAFEATAPGWKGRLFTPSLEQHLNRLKAGLDYLKAVL